MTARPLVPAPDSLGLASPAIGPWFSDSALSLGAPDGDLAVGFTPSATVKWLPPARGILSFHFATPTRPKGLAPLRSATGSAAFTDGHLVCLFQLLPEVETRLDALAVGIPSLDGVAHGTAPTRPTPRWFAVESSVVTTGSTVADVAGVWSNGFESGASDADKLASIGLSGTAGSLANAEKAASVLLGPGAVVGSGDELASLPASPHRLWAFDVRGRAIDPGAVAAWWAFLATSLFDNLWASGGANRTCPVADARTLHLVSVHEGPLDGNLLARIDVGGCGGSATDVARPASGSTPVTIGFSAAPDPDTAPAPRAALLPSGIFGQSASIWPAGPVDAALKRDYARVAIVDVERHLTGQARSPTATTPSSGEIRRAADQNRASTRVVVGRAARADSAPLPLRPSLDDAADALVALLRDSAPVTLVTSQLDRDHGPLAPLPVVAAPLPSSLPTPTVRALVGGGAASGGTVAAQLALVEFSLDPGLAGATLRFWPNSIDLATGRRRATDGGVGRVRSDGKVSLVARLPDGADAASLLGATVLLAHGAAARLFGELRFTRPLAVGGAAVAWSSASGSIIACEQDSFPGTSAASGILPGTTLVADPGGSASLIDRATLPASLFSADTVVRTLGAGDRVLLTEPAFKSEPVGSDTPLLAATGATVEQVARGGVLRSTGPGTPLPSQLALTSAAAAFDAGSARAVLVPPPALSRLHEIGAVQQGHPGSPATAECAGVGLDLHGPAALLVAEVLGATAIAATPAMVAAAASRISSPAEPSGAALWAAPLRTQAAGVEGERDLDSKVKDASNGYPFDGDEAAARSWYSAQASITLAAPSAGREAVQLRAMSRRALAAARGLQEGAIALAAAFSRAEDLVYVETPALDLLPIGGSDDRLEPLQILVNRLAARPSLCVVVCVPVQDLVGAPADLVRVRADSLKGALSSLAAAAPGRFASFCPNAGAGRSLRLLTTTVVIDDVLALVGSTHLSRRGLSFDSSLSVALLDEQCARGRGQSLTRLRRALLAARLGLPSTLVPDEGLHLVKAVHDLASRASARLSTATLPVVDPPVTDSDRTFWDRDGTTAPNPADLTAWLAVLGAGNVLR